MIRYEYFNYKKGFPLIQKCYYKEKSNIINLYIRSTSLMNNFYDDIGYEGNKKYYLFSYGDWYDENGVCCDYDVSEYVFCEIKVFLSRDYRICYHDYVTDQINISLVPYSLLHF